MRVLQLLADVLLSFVYRNLSKEIYCAFKKSPVVRSEQQIDAVNEAELR